MIRFFFAAIFMLVMAAPDAVAQETSPIQTLLQEQGDVIAKSSRKTIAPAIDALAASGLPAALVVLEKWQNKEMYRRKSDGAFFWAEKVDRDTLRIHDFADGALVVDAIAKDFKQLKPNSGIRGMIGAALVQFQLSDPDPARRSAALDAITRDAQASHLAALRGAIESETDLTLRAKKSRLERLLTIRFDENAAARITAIESFKGDLGVDLRGALNPIVVSKRIASPDQPPADANIKAMLKPGSDTFPKNAAYALLIAADFAPAAISARDKRAALEANIQGDQVAGFAVASLNTDAARDAAYAALAAQNIVPLTATDAQIEASIKAHNFYDLYKEPNAEITTAAAKALQSIELKVGANQFLDLTLDALSLASIYFLAAIGLAITFGVMGVINMAHGEFIMMGAYTGYVVQQFITDYTLSIIVAIPMAFAVTFAAGVAMERLVIRWLYNRPLETLLATFGISIALQQIAKNIFGTQARPLTSPAWLDGAWVLNDVVSISYIRIAIFVLALIFLGVFLFIMKKTRLGLETRAVTQNPKMAASMGINPDRVNMLTFGLGSGIAGIAGVAIGLYAKVTSELGADYIVQSFMTVVVGGVGNIWGTLLGATMIGSLQKGIEWFNPSNTLAAQTYMIIFIIIFIQFRPRGIIALKGRAAGD